VACNRHEEQSNTKSAGEEKPLSSSGQDNEKVLNVYNWLDYIAPNTVARFEKETGIKKALIGSDESGVRWIVSALSVPELESLAALHRLGTSKCDAEHRRQ